MRCKSTVDEKDAKVQKKNWEIDVVKTKVWIFKSI